MSKFEVLCVTLLFRFCMHSRAFKCQRGRDYVKVNARTLLRCVHGCVCACLSKHMSFSCVCTRACVRACLCLSGAFWSNWQLLSSNMGFFTVLAPRTNEGHLKTSHLNMILPLRYSKSMTSRKQNKCLPIQLLFADSLQDVVILVMTSPIGKIRNVIVQKRYPEGGKK